MAEPIIFARSPRSHDGWQRDPERCIWIAMRPCGDPDPPKIVWHFSNLDIAIGDIGEIFIEAAGGAGGLDHSNLPATMPVLKLGKLYNGEPTDLDTTTLSTTLGSFNAGHDISVEPGELGNYHSLWLEFCGPAGEGAIPGAYGITTMKFGMN